MKRRTLSTTWLALLLLSAASYLLADGPQTSASLLFFVAGLKLAMIQAVFMELLGCRPLFLRLALAVDALILLLLGVAFDL